MCHQCTNLQANTITAIILWSSVPTTPISINYDWLNNGPQLNWQYLPRNVKSAFQPLSNTITPQLHNMCKLCIQRWGWCENKSYCMFICYASFTLEQVIDQPLQTIKLCKLKGNAIFSVALYFVIKSLCCRSWRSLISRVNGQERKPEFTVLG